MFIYGARCLAAVGSVGVDALRYNCFGRNRISPYRIDLNVDHRWCISRQFHGCVESTKFSITRDFYVYVRKKRKSRNQFYLCENWAHNSPISSHKNRQIRSASDSKFDLLHFGLNCSIRLYCANDASMIKNKLIWKLFEDFIAFLLINCTNASILASIICCLLLFAIREDAMSFW